MAKNQQNQNPTDSDAGGNQVLIVPHKSALLAGHDNIVHVLVRVQAPDVNPAGPTERPPYQIAFVLDRSGSMNGQPLLQARRCVAAMLERLRPDDCAALVSFDNRIKVNVPCSPVGDRQVFMTALRTIDAGGNTNLYGGWEQGAEQLISSEGDFGLKRVLILSDGNANEGVKDIPSMTEGVKAAVARGVTTSTYGLGRDFNEDLMIGLGTAGEGNHYYGETAADLMDPFREEFDLLADISARKLTLSVQVAPGVSVRLRNDYTVEADREGMLNIRLPDLAYGSEAWALFEVKVPWQESMGTAEAAILQVQVTGQQVDGTPAHFPPAQLSMPSLSAPAWNSVASHDLVMQRVTEIRAAEMLKRAMQAARVADFDQMNRIIAEAQAEFANNPWVKAVMDEIAILQNEPARFSKSAAYSAAKMSKRLAPKDEGLDVLMDERSYLRRKSNQGKGDPTP